MGQRQKREGNVRPHPHGGIQFDFRYQGRRLRPTLDIPWNKTNAAAAERLLTKMRQEMREGTFDITAHFPDYKKGEQVAPVEPVSGDEKLVTVRQFAQYFLETSKLKFSTLDRYHRTLNSYWLKWYGDKPIVAVSYTDVNLRLSKEMKAREWSAKTFNNVLSAGRAIWDEAAKHRKLDNPLMKIEFAELQDSEPDPFAKNEVPVILQRIGTKAGPEWCDYFEFAFFTGLRPNEQIELKWADIDLKARVMRISRGRIEKAVGPTKTYKAREVPLLPQAFAVLQRQRARTQLKEHGYVFENHGMTKERKAYRREIKGKLTLVSGGLHTRISEPRPFADIQVQGDVWLDSLRNWPTIRYRPPKSTRSTFATMLLMAGVEWRLAAQIMGHSPEVFHKNYAKWIPGAERDRELQKLVAFTADLEPPRMVTKG